MRMVMRMSVRMFLRMVANVHENDHENVRENGHENVQLFAFSTLVQVPSRQLSLPRYSVCNRLLARNIISQYVDVCTFPKDAGVLMGFNVPIKVFKCVTSRRRSGLFYYYDCVSAFNAQQANLQQMWDISS